MKVKAYTKNNIATKMKHFPCSFHGQAFLSCGGPSLNANEELSPIAVLERTISVVSPCLLVFVLIIKLYEVSEPN